jgi:hypothetical protein
MGFDCRLNLLKVTSKVLKAENFPTNAEHNPTSFILLQVHITTHHILLLPKIASWLNIFFCISGVARQKIRAASAGDFSLLCLI